MTEIENSLNFFTGLKILATEKVSRHSNFAPRAASTNPSVKLRKVLFLKRNFAFYALIGLSIFFAARVMADGPLQTSDPEHAQLIAMGYEVRSTEGGSIAQRGNRIMWVARDENFVFLMRSFNLDAEKVEKNEFKALQAINRLNLALDYSLVLSENKKNLVCGIYYRGPYERKSFAEAISAIEICNIIFDSEPSLLGLNP